MSKEIRQHDLAVLDELNRRQFMRTMGLGGAFVLGGATGLMLPTDRSGWVRVPDAYAQASDRNMVGKSGGTLRSAWAADVFTLDGRSVTGLKSWQINYNFYNKLFRYAIRDGKLVFEADLATSWNYDGKSLKVKLREDVVFHDGQPMTSADVKYSLDTIIDPEFASSIRPWFTSITEVKTNGPYEVEFVTEFPVGSLLKNFALFHGIVPNKVDESRDMVLNPIGTGPFKFVEWVQGDHITLVRNEKYFRKGLPYLDGIRYQPITDSSVKLTNLATGAIDWLDETPLKDVARLREEGKFKLVDTATGAWMPMIMFNTSKPPFDNKKLRQAVVWALDKKELLKLVYFGNGTIAYQAIPPWVGMDTGVNLYEGAPNLDKAKQLMKEAGYPDGIKVEIRQISEAFTESVATTVFKSQLAKIGMDVDIKLSEIGVFFTDMVNANYQFAPVAFSGMYDPDQILSLNLETGSFFNWVHYSNPELDKLFQEARKGLDDAERMKAYAKAEQIIQEELPIHYYMHVIVTYAMQPYVMGFMPLHSQETWFEETWMDV